MTVCLFDILCVLALADFPKKTSLPAPGMTYLGLAWHFKRYAHEQSEEDRERYLFAEEEAQAKGIGLWSDPDPVPPWEWRNRSR